MRTGTTTAKSDAVLRFIDRFTDCGRRGEVIDCFTNGCCYWFARVLAERFGGELMYAPKENHFATEIAGRIYDITGDVTERWEWMRWEDYQEQEPGRGALIQEHCMMF